MILEAVHGVQVPWLYPVGLPEWLQLPETIKRRGEFNLITLQVREGYVRLPAHPANGRLDAFFEGLVIFLALSTVWLAAFLFVRRRAHSMQPAAPAPAGIEIA